jgi:hypothetical protein
MCLVDVPSEWELRSVAAQPADLPQPRGAWRSTAPAAFASFLVLAASFANLLAYHQYPFLRAEVLILLAGCAAIAAGYWALYLFSGPLGRACLEGFLAYLAIDFDAGSPMVAFAAAVLLGAASYLGRRSLLPVVSIMSVVVIGSALGGIAEARPALSTSGGEGTPAGATHPAVLHVFLDEHGGIASIPDPSVRATLGDMYARHGFHLFSRAYSRHFQTVNAIPDVLNFGSPGQSRRLPAGIEVGPTRYLSAMQDAGYSLHFYQSEYADFCSYYRKAACTRYWSPSLAFVEPLPVGAAEKARLIAFKLVDLSTARKNLARFYEGVAPQAKTERVDLGFRARSGTLGAFAALRQLTSDARSAKPGEAYFAHLLVPHYPYVATRDCKILPPSRWEFRNSDHSLGLRQAASNEQLLCLAKRLDALIGAFRASPGGSNGIIVIHGDHGSRIANVDPKTRNRDRLTPRDMLAGYNTLFAVRAPHLRSGLDPTPSATPDILEALVRNKFASLDGVKPANHRVFLDAPGMHVGEGVSVHDAWAAAD